MGAAETSSRPPASGKTLPNGIDVRSGQVVLRVTAIRDDVLRVRLGTKGQLPEDASWAVSQDARGQSAEVVKETEGNTFGFRTRSLRVRIEQVGLRLTISDLEGNVLQEDPSGWPAEFHGDTFRVYKKMPAD
jgi:alpha-glucosidase